MIKDIIKIMTERIRRNDLCWCGSGKKYKNCCINLNKTVEEIPASIDMPTISNNSISKKKDSSKRIVPSHIKRPEYVKTGGGEDDSSVKNRLTGEEIKQMRQTCRAARRVLDKGIKAVRPGVTTNYIDAIIHNACIAEGGYPSPLNYNGFPKSVCTSVNEVICHGIPNDQQLQNGDIVNIDVTLFLNGLHGDCSETVAVGNIDTQSQNLLTVTYKSMMLGINAIKQNGLIRDIGNAIEKYVQEYGYSVVRSYCGHGIGKLFHSDPTIPHYYDSRRCVKIEPGMIFTVEPMVNMGTWKSKIMNDGWTAVTVDLQRSAQFEHTILVTQDGIDILTLPE